MKMKKLSQQYQGYCHHHTILHHSMVTNTFVQEILRDGGHTMIHYWHFYRRD